MPKEHQNQLDGIATHFMPSSIRCTQLNTRASLLTGEATVFPDYKLIEQSKPVWPPESKYGEKYGIHHQPSHFAIDKETTTIEGWDDYDPHTMRKHLRNMRIAGVDTIIFNFYGGKTDQGLKTELEEPMRLFFEELTTEPEFTSMHGYPMICLSMPRTQLPVPSDGSAIDSLRDAYPITPSSLRETIIYLIQHYANRPSFLQVNNKLPISFFDILRLSNQAEWDIDGVKKTLDTVRSEVQRLYGKELFFSTKVVSSSEAKLAETLGFDGVFSYVLLPDWLDRIRHPIQEYDELVEKRVKLWDEIRSATRLPCMFPANPGWDPTGRCEPYNLNILLAQLKKNGGGYPQLPIVVGQTAHGFETMLRHQRCDALKNPAGLRFGLATPANEITIGSCATLYPYNSQEKTLDSSYSTAISTVYQKELF